jgi:deoxyribodipyrimidine photo-lyase
VTALVWFRRDLRLHDQPALRAALAAHDAIVPVFCLDDRLLHGRHASGPRTQFLLEALHDLDTGLRERGGGLVLRRGRPERELPLLARETGASAVYISEEVTPYGRSRDGATGAALRADGIVTHASPGVTVVDDVRAVRTHAGAPYGVFTPFLRAWSGQPRRAVLPAPRALALPAGVRTGEIPRLEELGLRQEVEEPLRGGETAARGRLDEFVNGPVSRYAEGQDALGEDGTSRLSAYLHLGCVSPLAVESRLPHGAGADAFRRQLAWRDFHHHVLAAHPRNAHEEHQPRYRGTLDWDGDDELFDAWCAGRTGFPLVDAGMRQLRREGWMHNRARLVTASFLTKELGVDWRRGERHFMRLLLDGDEANNNGNWQWVTSVGVDPQPYFRRIYNPARHMERFDPEGTYVRRYVPELANVPDAHLGEPWTMPDELQRSCGCVIGRDYPAPVVDRKLARQRAIERYRAAAAAAA